MTLCIVLVLSSTGLVASPIQSGPLDGAVVAGDSSAGIVYRSGTGGMTILRSDGTSVSLETKWLTPTTYLGSRGDFVVGSSRRSPQSGSLVGVWTTNGKAVDWSVGARAFNTKRITAAGRLLHTVPNPNGTLYVQEGNDLFDLNYKLDSRWNPIQERTEDQYLPSGDDREPVERNLSPISALHSSWIAVTATDDNGVMTVFTFRGPDSEPRMAQPVSKSARMSATCVNDSAEIAGLVKVGKSTTGYVLVGTNYSLISPPKGAAKGYIARPDWYTNDHVAFGRDADSHGEVWVWQNGKTQWLKDAIPDGFVSATNPLEGADGKSILAQFKSKDGKTVWMRVSVK